jgi:hypothetical protein
LLHGNLKKTIELLVQNLGNFLIRNPKFSIQKKEENSSCHDVDTDVDALPLDQRKLLVSELANDPGQLQLLSNDMGCCDEYESKKTLFKA